jgi:hypothetical protein
MTGYCGDVVGVRLGVGVAKVQPKASKLTSSKASKQLSLFSARKYPTKRLLPTPQIIAENVAIR